MTDLEREEALRLAKKAGFPKYMCDTDAAKECIEKLIRLARQSAPQGEPVAWTVFNGSPCSICGKPSSLTINYPPPDRHFCPEHSPATFCTAQISSPHAQSGYHLSQEQQQALKRAQLRSTKLIDQLDVVRDALRWRALRDWPYAQGKLVPDWPMWGPGAEYPTAGAVIDFRVDQYIASMQSAPTDDLNTCPDGTRRSSKT